MPTWVSHDSRFDQLTPLSSVATLHAHTHDGFAVNELLPVLKKKGNPGQEEMKGVFDRYEAKHRPRSETSLKVSRFFTRYEAMDTWYFRLLRVISPWIPDSIKVKFGLRLLIGAPVLDFLPAPDKNSSA